MLMLLYNAPALCIHLAGLLCLDMYKRTTGVLFIYKEHMGLFGLT